jgi:hypothetical protein
MVLTLTILIAACAVPPANQPQQLSEEVRTPALPDLGEAPELTNDTWLNTETPLRLADLRGKVVLLDMWTFG